MDDGRVHDGAGGDANAAALQIQVHRVQHRSAQIVLLQQVAEVARSSFRPAPAHAQIDARKPPQHRRIVQRFLHAGVGQVEPLLHESKSAA